jgi:hypothetical protein
MLKHPALKKKKMNTDNSRFRIQSMWRFGSARPSDRKVSNHHPGINETIFRVYTKKDRSFSVKRVHIISKSITHAHGLCALFGFASLCPSLLQRLEMPTVCGIVAVIISVSSIYPFVDHYKNSARERFGKRT